MLDDGHETPESGDVRAPSGSDWMVCSDQAVPFHCIATGSVSELRSKLPTAVHSEAALQDTPLSWLEVASAGTGGAAKDQASLAYFSA
jgi:hypothetical protein